MEEHYRRYNLDIMNKALEIKSILMATIYRNRDRKRFHHTTEAEPINILFNRLLKCSYGGKPVFMPDGSEIIRSDSENSYMISLKLITPFPDVNMEEAIKKEIQNKFIAFYTYGDNKMLNIAGLSEEYIQFITHNSSAINFLYTIFFLGENVIVKL